MVNATGDPTRTRDRNAAFVSSVSGKLKLDASHRFIKATGNLDQIQRKQYIENIGVRLTKLTPATRRVLLAVCGAMYLEHVPSKGYVFREYVNRAVVASSLGREKLVPYDIRMLRELCAQRLVVERKHPLPRKRYGDIWLGAGAEYVYTIPLDVLYCVLYHDSKQRPRLLALAPGQVSAAAPVKPLTDGETNRLPKPSWYETERSLWERVRDWIGF